MQKAKAGLLGTFLRFMIIFFSNILCNRLYFRKPMPRRKQSLGSLLAESARPGHAARCVPAFQQAA